MCKPRLRLNRWMNCFLREGEREKRERERERECRRFGISICRCFDVSTYDGKVKAARRVECAETEGITSVEVLLCHITHHPRRVLRKKERKTYVNRLFIVQTWTRPEEEGDTTPVSMHGLGLEVYLAHHTAHGTLYTRYTHHQHTVHMVHTGQ